MRFESLICHGRICRLMTSKKNVSEKSLLILKRNLTYIFYFSYLVIAEFNVQLCNGSEANLKITDNLGAVIPIEKFSDIIKTFYNGSMFTVIVEYDWSVMQNSMQMVTPLVGITQLNLL